MAAHTPLKADALPTRTVARRAMASRSTLLNVSRRTDLIAHISNPLAIRTWFWDEACIRHNER